MGEKGWLMEVRVLALQNTKEQKEYDRTLYSFLLGGEPQWWMEEGRCFYGKPVGDHCISKCIILTNSNNNGIVSTKLKHIF